MTNKDKVEIVDDILSDDELLEVSSDTTVEEPYDYMEKYEKEKAEEDSLVAGTINIRMKATHKKYHKGDDYMVTKRELNKIPAKKYIVL